MRELCITAALLVALAGCNSGSDGGTNTPEPSSDNHQTESRVANKVGIFLDSPVTGIKVVRPNGESALTGQWGEFRYAEGETLAFYLGGLRLGNTTGKAEITPLDLFAAANSNDRRVTNLLRLLQSLDANNDPSDGIQLSDLPEVSANIQLDQTDNAFEADSDIVALLQKRRPGLRLVSTAAARAHFESSRIQAAKQGLWNGILTFEGQDYSVQGITSLPDEFNGLYQAINGKSYTVKVTKTGDNSAEIWVNSFIPTNLGFQLNVSKFSRGLLQQDESGWTFSGETGTSLRIQKRQTAVQLRTGYYLADNGGGSANVCSNGILFLQAGQGSALDETTYIGMAYLDKQGLQYFIVPQSNAGSIYSGKLTIQNELQFKLDLPNGTALTLHNSMQIAQAQSLCK